MRVLDTALAGVDDPSAMAAGHVDRIVYKATLRRRQ
jgi:hypothetical protein